MDDELARWLATITHRRRTTLDDFSFSFLFCPLFFFYFPSVHSPDSPMEANLGIMVT